MRYKNWETVLIALRRSSLCIQFLRNYEDWYEREHWVPFIKFLLKIRFETSSYLFLTLFVKKILAMVCYFYPLC